MGFDHYTVTKSLNVVTDSLNNIGCEHPVFLTVAVKILLQAKESIYIKRKYYLLLIPVCR